MTEPILRITGLSHRYSVQWAIRDIDMELGGHGIYGLLGSNGAGKSTLMNIVCGVLKQTAGTVQIGGVDAKEHPVEAKRLIGFLPQTPPLHNDLTVEEYLRYTAHLRQMPEAEINPALDRVLERCNIGHFRKRLIGNLSGGYRQRVGIAQAIIHEPALVVLDEPTNGLDPNQILEVRQLIREIAAERTVILSTHILVEVKALCDTIFMVEQGEIVFRGTVDEFDNHIKPSTLLATFASAPSAAELAELEGVSHAEELSAGRFRVHYAEAAAALDAVVAASVERGWHLREIGVERSSMDTVFASLSK